MDDASSDTFSETQLTWWQQYFAFVHRRFGDSLARAMRHVGRISEPYPRNSGWKRSEWNLEDDAVVSREMSSDADVIRERHVAGDVHDVFAQ